MHTALSSFVTYSGRASSIALLLTLQRLKEEFMYLCNLEVSRLHYIQLRCASVRPLVAHDACLGIAVAMPNA